MNAPMSAIAIPVNMYWNPMILWSVDHRYLWKNDCLAWPPWPAAPAWASCAITCSAMGPPSWGLRLRLARGRGHGRGLDVDAAVHDAVSDAADLGALDVEGAGPRGLEPPGNGPAGPRVLFQPE